MKGDIRREGIIARLQSATGPVSAGSLAEEFEVSRQIIVKDIAKLRDTGYNIQALSRGYLYHETSLPRRVFKMFHTDEEVEEELNLIVDAGGSVKDVFIYHKVYNKLRAEMNIKSRRDVEKFLENIKSGKSHLLMNVTSGYHYHTVVADNEETLDIIEEKLRKRGFLAPLQEYEPVEIKN